MKPNPPTLTLRIFVFTSVLFLSTLICSIVWGTTVADHLCNCTDSVPGFLNYWVPGDWAHGKIEYVSEIHTGLSMSEPDVIKEGWSRFSLWCLWLIMFGGSIALSFAVARYFPASSPSLRGLSV